MGLWPEPLVAAVEAVSVVVLEHAVNRLSESSNSRILFIYSSLPTQKSRKKGNKEVRAIDASANLYNYNIDQGCKFANAELIRG
jgi:hypothetical protein